MAKLPDVTSLDVAQPRPNMGVVGYDSGAATRAGANLGATVANIGQAMGEREDQLNYAKAKSAYLQTKISTQAALDNDPNYQTHQQTYEKAMQKAQENALGMLSNGRDRARFQQDVGLTYAEGLAEVQKKAFSKEADANRGSLIDLINSNRESAINAPDEATRVQFLRATNDAITGAANKGYLGQDDAAKLRKTAGESYAVGTIESLPLDQQVKRLSSQEKGTSLDFIPSDKRAEMLQKAQRELRAEEDRKRILANQEMALRRDELSFRQQDAQAAYFTGQDFPNAPVEADFKASYPAGEAARRWQSFKSIQDASHDIHNLYMASPEERSAIIQRNTPVPGDGFAEKQRMHGLLLEVNNRIESQQKSDPAAFVAQYNPSIQQAYTNAANDPAAASQYALMTLAEQKRLGIKEPRILPKQAADQIAGMFYDQKEGGNNPAQLMDELQQQWGKAWPEVYKQLSKEEKLPPAALVIPNMSDAGAKERLARWSLVKDDVFKERLANPTQDNKDIDSNLQNLMGPFWNSLSVQNGGEQTFSTFQSQAKKLALGYAASGKSPADAAKQAFDETVGHAYSFGPTYRVPKEQMPEEVMQGTQAVINNADKLNIAPFLPRGSEQLSSQQIYNRNLAYAKPAPGGGYQTQLPPEQEQAFQQWAKKNNVPVDSSSTSDYDMRGFYKGLMSNDPNARTGVNANDGKLHFSDYWKTPYHQSFSAESQYADSAKAPRWNEKDQLVLPNGQIVFDERAKGLNREQADKATLDIIKNYPVWVTNNDETGLVLYAQGNNGLNLVRDKSGQPVQMTWQQLRDAAKATPKDAFRYPYSGEGQASGNDAYRSTGGSYPYPYNEPSPQ